jgi:hypothetical protein
MERQKIKDIIKEAQTTLKKMNLSEPSQQPPRRVLLDGNLVMRLEEQRVPIALDDRLRKRWRV